jgi:uncharacterized protein (TIGR00290 family)
MLTQDGNRSRSHGLRPEVLCAQAAALGLPLLTANATWERYEAEFIKLLDMASQQFQATHVIFGDVFPEAHREWVEKVCRTCHLTGLEPLWAQSTDSLVHEFLTCGGEATIVTIRDEVLDASWLGRRLDKAAVDELNALGLDPCGEKGEYHTFVTYFPGFNRKLQPKAMTAQRHDGCTLLDFTLL